MQIHDFKKEQKHLYQPSARAVEQVNVPPMHFLTEKVIRTPPRNMPRPLRHCTRSHTA